MQIQRDGCRRASARSLIKSVVRQTHQFFMEDTLVHELQVNGNFGHELHLIQHLGLEVDARLTHRAEELFERLCPRPPADYLDKLNGELEILGWIAASPDTVHDIIHISPSFLVKYGIDKNASAAERSCQAEKAYRELDARFVRMTGRRPYADEFFSSLRRETEKAAKENRPKQVHRTILRNPPSKGRKMSF